MDIVAMIPARFGSKGLPNKNIRSLCGRPLISYSVKAALNCRKIKEVYVNSDSQAILNIGIDLGAQPFLRPKGLAEDATSMKQVCIHFVNTLKKQGKSFDAVIVLYPVYPFRDSADLDHMIKEFVNMGGHRPLIGMKIPKTHPYLCYRLTGNGVPKPVLTYDANKYFRRQQYPTFFEINHWACVLPIKCLPALNAQLMDKNTYGYVISNRGAAVNIDTFEDFQYAEFLMGHDADSGVKNGHHYAGYKNREKSNVS